MIYVAAFVVVAINSNIISHAALIAAKMSFHIFNSVWGSGHQLFAIKAGYGYFASFPAVMATAPPKFEHALTAAKMLFRGLDSAQRPSQRFFTSDAAYNMIRFPSAAYATHLGIVAGSIGKSAAIWAEKRIDFVSSFSGFGITTDICYAGF